MKKLTAGIFAGILTIVTVNAADAAIASKAYVDQQRDAVAANVTSLTQTVTDNKTAADVAISTINTALGNGTTDGALKDIKDLQSAVQGLAGDGTGSVADQIASALGDGIGGEGEPKDVTAALALKADKATTYTKTEVDGLVGAKANSATTLEGYGITDAYTKTVADETFATKTALETTDGKADANATAIETLQGITTGLTAAKVTQITTNATNIENLTKAGGTLETELAKKVDINKTVASQMITTDANGQLTTLPVTAGQNGTYVLTATITDGKATYFWENIQREETAGGNGGTEPAAGGEPSNE